MKDSGKAPRKCTICYGYGYLESDTFPSAEPVDCFRCGGRGRV